MRKLSLFLLLACIPGLAQTYTPTKYVAWLTSSDGGATFEPNTNTLGGAPSYTPTQYVAILCQASAGAPFTLCASSSATGTVTSIGTTSPITGGTITSTGTIACPTCVAATSPGIGIAHFAGSTQTVTSSAVGLASADVTGILPVANGGTNSGTAAGALSNLLGNPAAGTYSVICSSGSSCTTTAAATGTTTTIASGTSALGTGAISSATCATVVTTTATGTASTDAIIWNPNGSIKAVTGYVPSTSGGLSIAAYPTTNAVNFDVCNWTSSSITPGAVTLNWRVVR